MSATVRWSTGPSLRAGMMIETLATMPHNHEPVVMAPAPLKDRLAHIVIREVLGRPRVTHILNDVGHARRQQRHGRQKRVYLINRVMRTVVNEQINIRARVLDELLYVSIFPLVAQIDHYALVAEHTPLLNVRAIDRRIWEELAPHIE